MSVISTSSEQSVKKEFMRGLIAATPIMISFIPFALLLGAQAIQKGLSSGEITLLTALNFAGGSEFVAIKLWSSPPHLLLIALMTLLVNSRHILMGAALAPYLRGLPKRKVLPALFFMCDESWAMGFADAKKSANQRFNFYYYLGSCAGMYVIWVMLTFIGACIAPFIGDVTHYGFDMALVAIFLVLLKGMWKGVAAAFPWLVSLIVAMVTYLLIPGAWYVIFGAVAGLMVAFITVNYD